MIGQNLRQFRILEQIGSGAMGVVYRAVDERNGRAAAVKVITGESGGVQSNTGQRFIREAEILQRFRHPNIVRFLGGGQYRKPPPQYVPELPRPERDQRPTPLGPLGKNDAQDADHERAAIALNRASAIAAEASHTAVGQSTVPAPPM